MVTEKLVWGFFIAFDGADDIQLVKVTNTKKEKQRRKLKLALQNKLGRKVTVRRIIYDDTEDINYEDKQVQVEGPKKEKESRGAF